MHQRPTTYSQLSKYDQINPRETKKAPPRPKQSLCPSVIPVVKDFSQSAIQDPKNSASSASSAVLVSKEETRLQAIRAQIKSLVLNTLFTSPVFARFYVDLVIHNFPNSNAAKIFRRHYKKILHRISLMSSTKSCTHIKVSGVRCGSPALRGEQFCYFHQQAHRSVRRPPFSRLHPIAIIEDEDAIQVSLMEVINGLVRNTLDVKRAALILRALHIAVKNASRVRLDSDVKRKVREIPEYAAPAEEALDPITNEAGRAVLDEEAELPAIAKKEPHRVDPEDPHWEERQEHGGRILARQTAVREARQANVGTALGRPGGVGTGGLGRQANVGTAAFGRSGSAATVVSADTVTKSSEQLNQRKPSAGVKPNGHNVAAPKERKNAAQRASAG